MDITTEIRVLLAKRNKPLVWLAEQIGTSQQNLFKKMKLNNWRINDVEEISNALGYEIKISFEDKSAEK